MCIRSFVTILGCCCLLACSLPLGGCKALDAFCKDVNDVGTGAGNLAKDPAAPLPADARTLLGGFALACTAGVALYQKIRNMDLRKTTGAIVQGVEDTPEGDRGPVLQNIEKRMVKAGAYKRRNAQVDELKATS